MSNHDHKHSKPKGRLKETLAKLKVLHTSPWVKANKMPPIEASILECILLDQLPMEVRMLPEMRLKGYDNWRMG